MAADTVSLSGIQPDSVETVILQPEITIVQPLIKTTPFVPTKPAKYLSYGGRDIELVEVASTDLDAGSSVFKYGDKFIYGHNSAAVFGGLEGLGYGTFSITINGATRQYAIVNRIIYDKNVKLGILQRNHAGSYMTAVANAIDKDTLVHYDLAMMTCHGTMLPGGDATERLVVFANEIR